MLSHGSFDSELKVSDEIQVKVKSIVSFGAFCTYKNVDLLLHLTQLSYGHVEDPKELLDIGDETAKTYRKIIQEAGTIIWNGPVGVFEFPAFANGTKSLGQAIADSTAFSLAGGGDTLAALAKFELADLVSYVCTGGGAFLGYLQGELLPAVAVLQQKESEHAQ